MFKKIHCYLLLITLFSCELSGEVESLEYSTREEGSNIPLEVVELGLSEPSKVKEKYFVKRHPRTSLCIGACLATSLTGVCFGIPSACMIYNSINSSVSTRPIPIYDNLSYNSTTPTSYLEIIESENIDEMSFNSTASHQLTFSDGSPITFQNERLSSSQRAKLTQYPDFRSNRWMTDIFPILKNKKIGQVSTIGSHNAFNYFGKDLSFCSSWNFPNTIYYNQKNSPAEQFDKGVRYFDTRIKVTDNGLESFHGGFSYWFGNNRIEKDLIALANKVRGTKEIIILQLRESEQLDSRTGLIKDELMKFFKENMDDLIVKKNELKHGNISNIKIKDILKSGNIILISENLTSVKYQNYVSHLSEFMIRPPSHNKEVSPKLYSEYVNSKFLEFKKNPYLKEKIVPLGYAYDPEYGSKFVNLHQKAIEYNSYFLNHEINRWLKQGFQFYLSMDFTDADEGYASHISRKMYEYYILNW